MGVEQSSDSVGDSSTGIGDRRDWRLSSMAAHIAEAAPMPAPMHGVVEQVRRDAIRAAMKIADRAIAALEYPPVCAGPGEGYDDGVDDAYRYMKDTARGAVRRALLRGYTA